MAGYLMPYGTHGESMVRAAGKMPADIVELLNHAELGRREGHYYVALFGLRRYDPLHVVDQIQRGLSYSAFVRFQRNTDLPYRLLAQAAEIPERTLARRKESGRFEPDETDRLVRASRIVARAIELFEGSTESARRWLTTPVGALGDRTPIEFTSTDVGAIEVESLIGRLAYGIPT